MVAVSRAQTTLVALVALVGCAKPSGWRKEVRIVVAGTPPQVIVYNGDGADCAGPPEGLVSTLDGQPMHLVEAGHLDHAWGLTRSHFPERHSVCRPSIFALDGAPPDASRTSIEVRLAAPAGEVSCTFENDPSVSPSVLTRSCRR